MTTDPTTARRIVCCCCARQLVSGVVLPSDQHRTIWKGARAAVAPGTAICGYCADELDADGLFPEERALVEAWQ